MPPSSAPKLGYTDDSAWELHQSHNRGTIPLGDRTEVPMRGRGSFSRAPGPPCGAGSGFACADGATRYAYADRSRIKGSAPGHPAAGALPPAPRGRAMQPCRVPQSRSRCLDGRLVLRPHEKTPGLFPGELCSTPLKGRDQGPPSCIYRKEDQPSPSRPWWRHRTRHGRRRP